MNGTIKFVDPEGRYGFIRFDDGSEAHFNLSDFIGDAPRGGERDRPVECQVHHDSRGAHATSIRLLDPKPTDLKPWQHPNALGRALLQYAVLPEPFIEPKTKIEYTSALHRLDDIALDETWHFGSQPPTRHPFPILFNYLNFTFVRITKQDLKSSHPPHAANLRLSADGKWSAFNTGLVDQLYEPIFALFRPNTSQTPPWVIYDFCVAGQGHSGVQLVSVFEDLPSPAKYFESNTEMLIDPDRAINIEISHVIIDGIRRDRFPYEFIRRNLEPRPPSGMSWEDYSGYAGTARQEFLDRLADALGADPPSQRGIKDRIESALDLAMRRTRWNYKTAIPNYHPRLDEMSHLLPLCLLDDDVPDVALVVSTLPSGIYQGRTILPLDWAYKNARLVCRPDSDWLTPVTIAESSTDEDADQHLGVDDASASSTSTPDDHSGPDASTSQEGGAEQDLWGEFAAANKVGDVVPGTINSLADFGAFVDLADGVKGLIHVSKIKAGYVEHPADELSEGQHVRVRIIDIDQTSQRIGLSMQDIDYP